jgi:hypothetical protein
MGGMRTKQELAMFLAQIIWESDFLRATAEYACAGGCPDHYQSTGLDFIFQIRLTICVCCKFLVATDQSVAWFIFLKIIFNSQLLFQS